jgi:hypothetical protein
MSPAKTKQRNDSERLCLQGALSMGSERLDESGAGYSSDDQLDEVRLP